MAEKFVKQAERYLHILFTESVDTFGNFQRCSVLRCDRNLFFKELTSLINIAFVVVFFEGPTPSAYEIEARYAAMFGKTQDLPLAVLVAVPVAFLIILTAVFIRALEKAKQKHGVGLVKKTDMNGDAVVMSESCSDKEFTNQVTSKLISG